MLEDGGNSN